MFLWPRDVTNMLEEIRRNQPAGFLLLTLQAKINGPPLSQIGDLSHFVFAFWWILFNKCIKDAQQSIQQFKVLFQDV